MKQLTALEIIDETVAFYSEDVSRRSLEGGRCIYLSSTGAKCGVGRCMNEEGLKQFGGSVDSVGSLVCEKAMFDENIFDDYLQEQYHGQNLNFWGEIQLFHDISKNWNSSEITDAGIQQARELRSLFTPQIIANVEN